MPFDQFTIEQLAGDLLPEPTLDQKIATGFHRTVTCNVEAGVHIEENRVNQVVDRVNTTGTAWLGSTLECAQCHDHKYDPFRMRDYYQFFAFFNNTPQEVEEPSKPTDVSHDFIGPYMELPQSRKHIARVQALKKQLDTQNTELADLKKRTESDFEAWLNTGPTNTPGVIKVLLAKPPASRSPKERKQLRAHYVKHDPEHKALNARIKSLREKIKGAEPDKTLVMVEMPAARETHIMKRGNYLETGEPVTAGVPGFLHRFDPELPVNRLGLARWLVDRENPLVARVVVNRWWGEVFGHGLVATQEDFGVQSAPPSHPGLLDWLAVEFMDSGWDMKHMMKVIVTSATYRQASRITPALLSADPKNRLYARAPRFRLDGERIRDTALTISGLLSTQMYGKPVMPYQPDKVWRQIGRNEPKWKEQMDANRWRRAVYIVYRRAAPYPSLVNFDAPDRGSCTVKRTRTNTPIQALTLLNNPAYIEMALALADRILQNAPSADRASRIAYGVQLATGRTARDEEIQILGDALSARMQVLAAAPGQAADIVAAASRAYAPGHGNVDELAAWLYLGNILLNLDEVVTKG